MPAADTLGHPGIVTEGRGRGAITAARKALAERGWRWAARTAARRYQKYGRYTA